MMFTPNREYHEGKHFLLTPESWITTRFKVSEDVQMVCILLRAFSRRVYADAVCKERDLTASDGG